MDTWKIIGDIAKIHDVTISLGPDGEGNHNISISVWETTHWGGGTDKLVADTEVRGISVAALTAAINIINEQIKK